MLGRGLFGVPDGAVLGRAVPDGAVLGGGFAGGGFVDAGDAAGEQAVLAAGVEVGEQDGDRLADDPAPVGRGAVAKQREPGAFQVK